MWRTESGRKQQRPDWRRLSVHTQNAKHEGKGSASQSPGKEYEQAAGVYHNANAEIRWKAAPGEGFRLSTVTLCDPVSSRALRPDQTVKAIGNADDLPLVLEDCSLNGRANQGG